MNEELTLELLLNRSNLTLEELKERFWKKVEDVSFFTDEDCWLWIGAKNSMGYGHMAVGRRTYYAHRISYVIYKNFIPENLFLLHKCDSPLCINPNHLIIGTQQNNIDDMFSKNRENRKEKLFCKRGHPYNEENTYIWRGIRACKICLGRKAFLSNIR